MKLKSILFKVTIKILKPFIHFAKRRYDSYKHLLPDYSYHAWAKQNELMCFVDQPIKYKPLISIVVPVYNPVLSHFWEMLYSVVNQHYENWELVLVNASSNKDIFEAVKKSKLVDTRIKLINIDNNRGISANTNIAIDKSAGEYIAFFDHDDLLHPCAIHSVIECLQFKVRPSILYSDEDKINDAGDLYFNPFFKDGWSPDLMENVNYMNHLTVVEADLVKKVGKLRPEFDGAQDYDLLLRVIDEFNPNIKHVPRVLYHWRAADSSTAKNITNKRYIFTAGERAIREHIKRRNIPARVESIPGRPGFYELAYKPTKYTVIIGRVSPSKYKACAKWIARLLNGVDPNQYELVVGEWYVNFIENKDCKLTDTTRIITLNDTLDEYWQQAILAASNPVIIGFKVASLPRNKKGLEQLAAVAADPRHSAVSPVILNNQGIIIDSGIMSISGFPKQIFEGCALPQNTYHGSTEFIRNVHDTTTNIVAWRTEDAKKTFVGSKYNYEDSPTLNTFDGLERRRSKDEGLFVIWAHTPFRFIGLLDNYGKDVETRQILNYTLDSKIHFDNWGEGNEVDN